MANELTLAEFAHVLFGTMWVGTSIYIEAVLVPIMKKAKTVGEFRHMLGILGKTSGFQGFSAVFVLITGLIYLYLKYPPLEAMLTFSSGQLVFVSFILVLGAIISGFAFLRPTAMKIAKAEWPDDPNATVPETVRTYERRLEAGSLASTVIVVVVLLLMVIAATGGL